MLNTLGLVGRISNDLVLRETNSRKKYVWFNLAVNRDYRNTNNEYETDFIPCITWEGTAELLCQYQSKGSLISIDGKLRIKPNKNDGNNFGALIVVAKTINYLERKKRKHSNSPEQNVLDVVDQVLENNKSNYCNNLLADNNMFPNIDDDDLPF